MTLFLLAYAAGVLTIASPCVLPVLPFVFARADRAFIRNGLPLLAGMALTFALVASLGAVAGGWAVEANHWGRQAALVLLALFGLALLFPRLGERAWQPLVAAGGRLAETAERRVAAGGSPFAASLLLGVATGLLWAPCAGPILGLILTGAALNGASLGTSVLLAAYAAGAATSLALALLLGGRVFRAMKRALPAGGLLRRAGGAAVLAAVGAIAFGLDTGLLARASYAGTVSLEQRLIDATRRGEAMDRIIPAQAPAAPPRLNLPVEGRIPSLAGAVEWLNSPPLSAESLRGKVVLVNFWTYSCINCLRTLPYVRAWAERYRDQGLVVIGVHTPEFAFERRTANVRRAAADLGVSYPIAIDNGFGIWRAFGNQYWPALYFVDAEGRIRHHRFGEGGYEMSEQVIQTLLAEAGRGTPRMAPVAIDGPGAQAPADPANLRSQETYLGYRNATNFASPGGAVRDAAEAYRPGRLRLNEWSLSGRWTIGEEFTALNEAGGSIAFRFHARDLHLVLGAPDGRPLRFQVTIDGQPPGASRGADVAADGTGVVTGQRLYQLIRQDGAVAPRTFEIRFLDPGAQAYAFTFG
ncbi:cytochrome c biogenesis protein DipZ [Plastoroseomonas hellenica]|uniref:cytochrome c biogenesis protein DipZ n=1 Tax=Plastoroseomonas hellenica TaxID=2687306 RepID=UPI001BA6D5AF|nr:cytochrome c biogenesis protein DipZ [Plastoroseomonas hellenica]MBR0646143.1 cytochrome c biogenesis protein DipZ [Plastoroseomonas hellenica]